MANRGSQIAEITGKPVGRRRRQNICMSLIIAASGTCCVAGRSDPADDNKAAAAAAARLGLDVIRARSRILGGFVCAGQIDPAQMGQIQCEILASAQINISPSGAIDFICALGDTVHQAR